MSEKKIEKIFNMETGTYDNKHILNTCNKRVSQEILDEVENGCSLETLEEIANGFDIFKYRTQITIHGLFPDISTNRIGGYVNLFQNKNRSIGVRYTAIDHDKKKRLFAIISSCTNYVVRENSTEFKLESYTPLDTSSEEAFKEPCRKAVEEVKRIDQSLFFGYASVYIQRGLFRTYLVKEINILCFYEKNFKTIVEQVCGMSYEDARHIHIEKLREQVRRDQEAHERWLKHQAEEERKKQIRIAKMEQFKKTTPPPSGFIIINNYMLKSGDIVTQPRFITEDEIQWCFWRISKIFGRIISTSCDENGKSNPSVRGRELQNTTFTGYVKRKAV